MQKKPIIRLIVGFVYFLVAGCSPTVLPPKSGTTPSVQVEATATDPARDTPMHATEEPVEEIGTPFPYDPAMQPLVDQAVADLSERLSLGLSQIEVLSAEAVTWPDSSLGCPQPGMAYLQVPQDGAQIRLRTARSGSADSVYSYHSGGSQGLFLCEQTLKVKETPPLLDTFVPPPEGEDT